MNHRTKIAIRKTMLEWSRKLNVTPLQALEEMAISTLDLDLPEHQIDGFFNQLVKYKNEELTND